MSTDFDPNFVGRVSITLRHRLECKIVTAGTVSVQDEDDVCPVSLPKEKHKSHPFEMKDKQPWIKANTPHKEMLVSMPTQNWWRS